MKNSAFLIAAAFPGTVLAHGVHPEVLMVAHETVHGGIVGAVALIAAALVLAWQKERGS